MSVLWEQLLSLTRTGPHNKDRKALLVLTVNKSQKNKQKALSENLKIWMHLDFFKFPEFQFYLDTLQSKSWPSYSESRKQLALPKVDKECFAMSALLINFIMARAFPLTSCLKDLNQEYSLWSLIIPRPFRIYKNSNLDNAYSDNKSHKLILISDFSNELQTLQTFWRNSLQLQGSPQEKWVTNIFDTWHC